VTWEPAAPWLPRFVAFPATAGDGLWINLRGPTRRSARRLRRDTAEFVLEVNRHWSAAFDPIPQAVIARWNEAASKEPTAEARHREFGRQWDERIAAEDAWRSARASQLWQRALSLIRDYERRGLLSPTEAAALHPGASASLNEVARRLDALANQDHRTVKGIDGDAQ
jgi:hypothetical protein